MEYKCKNCGYKRGQHQAKTLNCPIGSGRLHAFCSFFKDKVYIEDLTKPIREKNQLFTL